MSEEMTLAELDKLEHEVSKWSGEVPLKCKVVHLLLALARRALEQPAPGVVTREHRAELLALAQESEPLAVDEYRLAQWLDHAVGAPIDCFAELSLEDAAQLIADREVAAYERGKREAGAVLEKLLGLVSTEDGTVVFRVLDDGSRHCQARLVAGRGDDAVRAAKQCAERLGLMKEGK